MRLKVKGNWVQTGLNIYQKNTIVNYFYSHGMNLRGQFCPLLDNSPTQQNCSILSNLGWKIKHHINIFGFWYKKIQQSINNVQEDSSITKTNILFSSLWLQFLVKYIYYLVYSLRFCISKPPAISNDSLQFHWKPFNLQFNLKLCDN